MTLLFLQWKNPEERYYLKHLTTESPIADFGMRIADQNWSAGVVEQRKDEHRTSNVQHRMLNEKEKKNDERRTIE